MVIATLDNSLNSRPLACSRDHQFSSPRISPRRAFTTSSKSSMIDSILLFKMELEEREEGVGVSYGTGTTTANRARKDCVAAGKECE